MMVFGYNRQAEATKKHLKCIGLLLQRSGIIKCNFAVKSTEYSV